MNLSDFARERHVEPQTVGKYVGRHPEVAKFTIKRGKDRELLTEAVEILDKVYPLPKPVQVIQGVPQEEYQKLLEENNRLMARMVELQNERIEDQKKLAAAEATAILLEDKEKQLSEKATDLDRERERTAKAEARLADQDVRIRELQDELDRERSKSWWDKLRGR
jgi:phosphoribosylanthranilate isomerase